GQALASRRRTPAPRATRTRTAGPQFHHAAGRSLVRGDAQALAPLVFPGAWAIATIAARNELPVFAVTPSPPLRRRATDRFPRGHRGTAPAESERERPRPALRSH